MSNPVWCIRWYSLPKSTTSFGGLLPETYGTRAEALHAKRLLDRDHSVRSNRFRPGVRSVVRYVVFARNEDDVHGL